MVADLLVEYYNNAVAARQHKLEAAAEAEREARAIAADDAAKRFTAYIYGLPHPDGVEEAVSVSFEYDDSGWWKASVAVDGCEIPFRAMHDGLDWLVQGGADFAFVASGKFWLAVGRALLWRQEMEQERERAEQFERAERAERAERTERTARERAEQAADKRAAKIARRVEMRRSVSGYTPDDVERWAYTLIEMTDAVANLLPQVESLRATLAQTDRNLDAAKAAALWGGVEGKNEQERKANSARAIATDPECCRLAENLAALEQALAEVEADYKAMAMRAGAWRAVIELRAGWLNSLR